MRISEDGCTFGRLCFGRFDFFVGDLGADGVMSRTAGVGAA